MDKPAYYRSGILASLPAWLICLALFSCKVPERPSSEVTPVTARQDVTRGARQASTWRFVYCVEAFEDGQALARLLESIAQTQPSGKRIEVIDCHATSADSLAAGPSLWFGTKPPEKLDVLSEQRGTMRFDNRITLAGGDLLALPYYRNPWNDGRSTTGVYYAKELPRLLAYLKERQQGMWDNIFWSRWSFEVHRENGDRIYGNYLDSTWAFDLDSEVYLHKPTDPILSTTDYRVFAFDGLQAGQDTAALRRLLDLAAGTATSATGKRRTTPLDVHLYPSIERLGIATGRMDDAYFDAQVSRLHLYVPPGEESDRALDPTIWIAMAHDRQPTAAGAFAQLLFAAELQRAADLPDATAELLKRELRYAKRIAALKDMSQDYPTEADARSGRIQWALALARVFTDAGSPPQRASLPPVPPVLAGMTFAHEGYRIYNGYGGRTVGPSLDSLSRLNVNALSIVPYTFQRDARKAAEFRIPRRAGSETDGATVHSIREARERGWYVLLKPQIWVGGGSWPGDIDMATDEAWQAWFRAYRYWILHYALLAEREGVDGLCIGTELVRSTIDQPARWKSVIGDIRSVYSGHLTYAANWGEEFENLTFWRELDAIGLNSYYPLSDEDAPSDEDLRRGAEGWCTMAAKVARREGKPLWLTEVGYRSVARPWKNPHAEAGERMMTANDQDRAYRALVHAVGASPEVSGMFVWKWPSYLGYGGRQDDSDRRFTPGGKPAAITLGEFYGRWKR